MRLGIRNLNIIRRVGMSKVIKTCSFCSVNNSRIKHSKYNGFNTSMYRTDYLGKKLIRKRKDMRGKV